MDLSSSPVRPPSSLHGLGHANRPLESSPLASPSMTLSSSSPTVAAHLRRQGLYKSLGSSSTSKPTRRTSLPARRPSAAGSVSSLFTSPTALPSAPVTSETQKAFLRGRFESRCMERITKSREKALVSKRHKRQGSDPFGDDYMDDGDEEEDETDEQVMQNEFFRRVMANQDRKLQHYYDYLYSVEVGDSFDPDIEDVSRWENELAEVPLAEVDGDADPTPDELEQEELEAYFQEYEAMKDFQDIPPEMFELDDDDVLDDHSMDMS